MLLTAHAVSEEDSLCPEWGWSTEGPLLKLLAPVPLALEEAAKVKTPLTILVALILHMPPVPLDIATEERRGISSFLTL